METKDYLAALFSTIKLSEKKRITLNEERQKWLERVELAKNKGMDDLGRQAADQAERIGSEIDQINAEIEELKQEAEKIRRSIPGEEARKRSIDPDLLEQELLMASGRMPGTEDEAALDREFENLKKNDANDLALKALKEKMNKDNLQ